MLRFALLGPFEAWRDSVRIPSDAWRTQKTQSVLKVLVDARGRHMRTERIADLVWPDADAAAARNSLQVAIRSIRTVLEPRLGKGARSRFVLTEPGGYRLASEGVEVDVDAFDRARALALAATRRGDTTTAMEQATAAAGLYRGDYLADDPDAEWALAPRERLNEAYLDLIERLGALLIAGSRHDQAIAWAERALGIDALREGLYAILMRAHLAAGRRAHAIAAHERCSRILRAELGVEPSPELRAILDESATAGRVTRSTPQIEIAAARAAPDPERAGPSFVGRGQELHALGEAWSAAGTASGLIAAVSGTAGIGKTRLLRELARSLEREARVIWAAAQESAAGSGLAPFLEAVAAWRDAASPTQRSRMADFEGSFSAGAQAQRYEALAQATRVMLGSGRGLVVLDDAHWADPDLLAALEYTARRLGPGALVALAIRSGESEPERLTSLLDRARDDGRLRSIRLEPLSREEVVVLARAWVPQATTAAIDEVVDLTRGHPLFVVETFRALAAGDRPAPTRTLHDAILSRVRRLPDPERDALGVASVAGGPFRADLATRVLGRPAHDVLAALDTLLSRELLSPSDDGRGYVVAHPLVLRATYDALSPGRRVAWHRRFADSLADVHADDPRLAAAERLRHLVAADAPQGEIADATIAAADRALARHSYADAARSLELGRHALEAHLPHQLVREPLAAIRERLADAYTGLSRWDDAAALYDEVLATAGRSRIDRARVLRKIGAALGEARGHVSDAIAALDRAEAELEGEPDHASLSERVRIDVTRAIVWYTGASFEAAARSAARAIEHATGASGVDDAVIDALLHAGLAAQRLGRLTESDRFLREALTRARAGGNRLAQARVLGRGIATVRLRSGDARGALAAFEEGHAIGRELGVPANDVVDLFDHAVYLVPTGELLRARAMLEESVARADAMGAEHLSVFASVVLGRVLLELGELSEARRVLEPAIAAGLRRGSNERASFGLVWLSAVARAEGATEEAVAHAQRALEVGASSHDTFARLGPLDQLAQAELARGRPGTAVELARRALDIAREAGYRRAEANMLRTVAEAEWAHGDRASSRRHLAEATALSPAAGDAYLRVRLQILRASTVLANRPRERERALRDALTLAKTIGAALLVREAEEALVR